VVNGTVILAAGVFTVNILWQLWMPNVSHIAKQISVSIDGANTGSGVIIEHQGDRYIVLTNWHVVDPTGKSAASKSSIIRTIDGKKYVVSAKKIARIANLDLATLEFSSKSHYQIARFGNSDRLSEGDTLYVSGWADPSPQLLDRSYQFLVGNLSGRLDKTPPGAHPPRDGYTLIYSVNALPGMSGGAVFDRHGNLVGIHGRANVDLRTGTVSAVMGIDINRYLRAKHHL
jgi:S1-C subfamily serine protease